MELTNAPAMFMHTMNDLFSNMLHFSMVVFLDDILVYFHIVKEHFVLLKKVLSHLCHYIFYCKLKKGSFLYNNTTFLGFNATPEGMRFSDSKV